MNAPSASSGRIIASPMRSHQDAPPNIMLAHDKSPAASEVTATTATEPAVNPLWIITASLAVFICFAATVVALG
jgi:hypothetical protein